jgi:hypothetical protein
LIDIRAKGCFEFQKMRTDCFALISALVLVYRVDSAQLAVSH